jgi:predicted transcriptional regulator/DNA-binding XRE family transcriptional regulator
MAKVAKKITSDVSKSSSEKCVGERLRALRLLAGLSQNELAARLHIGQGALSRLEKRSDLQLSTLRSYVESVGASLKIEASFGNAGECLDIFDEGRVDDNQYLLPIFKEEHFRPSRDVVLSIKPHYTSLILKGRKSVELRRRFPAQMPSGTLAFLYSTTPEQAVVGTALIMKVHKKPVKAIWSKFAKSACIDKGDFEAYFAGLHEGFALQFEDVRCFRRAVGLKELRERFSFEPPQSFLYARPFLREALLYERSEVPY